MTVRPIVRYPDPRLKTPAEPVTTFDAQLAELSTDLLDTMRAAPGIGITAPHVGILKALTVIELEAGAGPSIFVNPVVTGVSTEMLRHMEGSVSMPGATEEVERPRSITLRYQTLDGSFREEEVSDLLSICLQHEIDQINGIFWLQRLSRLKRDRLIRKFEKTRSAAGPSR
jgi:peptide deformylase